MILKKCPLWQPLQLAESSQNYVLWQRNAYLFIIIQVRKKTKTLYEPSCQSIKQFIKTVSPPELVLHDHAFHFIWAVWASWISPFIWCNSRSGFYPSPVTTSWRTILHTEAENVQASSIQPSPLTMHWEWSQTNLVAPGILNKGNSLKV